MTVLPPRRAPGPPAGRRCRRPGAVALEARPARGAPSQDGEQALERTAPWTSLRLFR
jgi:hypothetical protein